MENENKPRLYLPEDELSVFDNPLIFTNKYEYDQNAALGMLGIQNPGIGKQWEGAKNAKGYKKTDNGVLITERAKINRNLPCPCGSGKKYKNCCLKKDKEKVK